MTTNSNEKRVETLERRQPQPDFVPARWLTREEGYKEMDEYFEREEADGVDFEKKEQAARARGEPEWVILLGRENRAEYYERKAKREAEEQKKATDNYLAL